MGFPAINFFYLALQGFELPSIEFPYLGTRGLVAIVMLIHIFFAELFIGYVLGSPILQLWSRRTGNPWMERLAHSMARFNILTFSVGATWAVMFLVVLLGFYPRVTTALFTHFFWFWPVIGMGVLVLTLWMFYLHYYRAKNRAQPLNIAAGFAAAFFIYIWMEILTGIDTFMVTGGGVAGQVAQDGGSVSSIGSALDSILNPMFYWMALHRIAGNLSWPAYAVAAWAAFAYRGAKSAEDKAFYDWAGSMGVIWGTVFLLLQPLSGFLNVYSLKWAYRPEGLPGADSPYDRLTGSGTGAGSFTSHMLLVNLGLIVGLFVLSNVAMYMGAQRHPDRAGRRPIQFFGLVAALAGLYSISPIAAWPFLYMRYIMIGIMILATVGALIAYVRGRRQFRYGNPSGRYRAVLLSLGILAAVVALGMGWMKSNARSPYTIYGQPSYTVENERPVTPDELQPDTSSGSREGNP
jgi:cytochrome bd ubiquinol oxidase subunit I